MPTQTDIDGVHAAMQRVLANDVLDECQRQRQGSAAAMGGTRPKAIFELNGEEWLIKFAEDDCPAEPLIEHAAMTLAAQAGISVAESLERGANAHMNRKCAVNPGK